MNILHVRKTIRFIGFSLLTGLPHVETIGYNAEIVPMFHVYLELDWPLPKVQLSPAF